MCANISICCVCIIETVISTCIVAAVIRRVRTVKPRVTQRFQTTLVFGPHEELIKHRQLRFRRAVVTDIVGFHNDIIHGRCIVQKHDERGLICAARIADLLREHERGIRVHSKPAQRALLQQGRELASQCALHVAVAHERGPVAPRRGRARRIGQRRGVLVLDVGARGGHGGGDLRAQSWVLQQRLGVRAVGAVSRRCECGEAGSERR